MTAATTGELVSSAQAQGVGIAAFNVITLEHAEAVLAASEATGVPVIVQVSENAVNFHDGRSAPLMAAVMALIASSRTLASLHLDHATSLELCRRAAGDGATSVMFDGSSLSYSENLRTTREASAWAADAGIFIEAELGAIGGKGGAHIPGVRTDPDEARGFVGETGVDALAVAVGSTHAQQDRSAVLEQDLISRLRSALTVPLVLHGSSGVRDDQIGSAIRNGIVKVNFGTALNIAFTQRMRERLARHPEESDPRPGLREARDAARAVAEHLIEVVRLSDVR